MQISVTLPPSDLRSRALSKSSVIPGSSHFSLEREEKKKKKEEQTCVWEFPPGERGKSDELHDNELCYTATQHTVLSLRLRAVRS